MLTSRNVGVLGGGQLGRMLMEAANRLNIQMTVLDVDNAPAKQISAHHGHITGSFSDRTSVSRLAGSCDVITAEIEHVDTYALEEVEGQVEVQPSWQSIRIIQDKFAQKEHLSRYAIPMAEYRELKSNTVEELEAIGEELGYPLMLKSKTLAYDGRGKIFYYAFFTHFLPWHYLIDVINFLGNYTVNSKASIPAAFDALKDRPLYAEKWASFKMVCDFNCLMNSKGPISDTAIGTGCHGC